MEIALSGMGSGQIISNGPLTIALNATFNGPMSYTAVDSPAGDEDLVVNSGATVTNLTAPLLLRAGDSLNLQAGSTVQATASITLAADVGPDPDAGTGAAVTLAGAITSTTSVINTQTGEDADVVLVAGSLSVAATGPALIFSLGGGNDTLTANGAVDASLTAPNGIVQIFGQGGADIFNLGDAINGAASISAVLTVVQGFDTSGASGFPADGADTFNVRISNTTPFDLEGDDPNLPTLPGDTVNIDFTGVGGVATQSHGIPNTTITAPGFQQLGYREMETVNGIGGLVNCCRRTRSARRCPAHQPCSPAAMATTCWPAAASPIRTVVGPVSPRWEITARRLTRTARTRTPRSSCSSRSGAAPATAHRWAP